MSTSSSAGKTRSLTVSDLQRLVKCATKALRARTAIMKARKSDRRKKALVFCLHWERVKETLLEWDRTVDRFPDFYDDLPREQVTMIFRISEFWDLAESHHLRDDQYEDCQETAIDGTVIIFSRNLETGEIIVPSDVAAFERAVDRLAKKVGMRSPIRMGSTEAERRATEALKGRPPNGKNWTTRTLAEAIGCSDGLINKLPAWTSYAAKMGITRADQYPRPRTVSLTPRIQATEVQKERETKRLIREQSKDDRQNKVKKSL